MVMLPAVLVGDPVRYGALTVFPLFSEVKHEVEYRLSDEAIGTGAVTVEEVSESGSVPDLLVTNTSDSRVLFLEGSELRGAKQNRVLNTSVLVAAHSTVKIPVSCVEQGRWRYRSKQFDASADHSSSKLRYILKRSATESVRAGRGVRSDQGTVWSEVGRQMSAMGASSETMAMSDTFEAVRSRSESYLKAFGYIEGATGLAVAVGDSIAAVDLFDKAETCRKVWDRLMRGFVMDALETSEPSESVSDSQVYDLLTRLRGVEWQSAPAVGEGQEFRVEADRGQTHASALFLGDAVVHGSAVLQTV